MFIFVYLYLCICVVVFTKIQKCTTWWSFSWLVIWALTGNGESGWHQRRLILILYHVHSRSRNQANEVYLYKQGKDVSSSNMKLRKLVDKSTAYFYTSLGFCQIPRCRNFLGRDFPISFYPRILGKHFGIFQDFHFCFICLSNLIIFINQSIFWNPKIQHVLYI